MTKRVSIPDGTSIRVSKENRDKINAFTKWGDFYNVNETIQDMLRIYSEYAKFKDEKAQAKA